MPDSPQQFPLPLKLDDSATFDNYWEGSNTEVVAQLKKIVSSDITSWLYLAAAEGSGVSHLLQAVSAYALEQDCSAIYIDMNEMLQLSISQTINQSDPDKANSSAEIELMESLDHYDLICLDNLRCIEDNPGWQEALFYLLVRLQNKAVSRIVFGANESATGLNIQLHDLQSRLAGAMAFQLKTYSDEEKSHIIKYQALKRGMTMNDELAGFIVRRYSRDIRRLVQAVNQLDKASMAESRKLTIPFVKKILTI